MVAARRKPADDLAGAVLNEVPAYARERWRALNGDFIDVDHLPAAPGAPWLVLFHGLESSSMSRCAVAFALAARARGWHFSVPHFRGCSGELNLAQADDRSTTLCDKPSVRPVFSF